MSIKISMLREWLDTLEDDDSVYIDDEKCLRSIKDDEAFTEVESKYEELT